MAEIKDLEVKKGVELPQNKAELPRKVLWSGIQLSPQQRMLMNETFRHYLEPLLKSGWKQANSPPPGVLPELLPDHMTIIAMQGLPEDMQNILGTEQQMTCLRFGKSDLAAAIHVHSLVRTNNPIPHITIAVSPQGKPFHSNGIVNWVDLLPKEQITVSGIVVEKTAR